MTARPVMDLRSHIEWKKAKIDWSLIKATEIIKEIKNSLQFFAIYVIRLRDILNPIESSRKSIRSEFFAARLSKVEISRL